jgi:hypothetical protein
MIYMCPYNAIGHIYTIYTHKYIRISVPTGGHIYTYALNDDIQRKHCPHDQRKKRYRGTHTKKKKDTEEALPAHQLQTLQVLSSAS